MNKVAHYLQQHLVGEVLTSSEVLRYFSTDESIFEIKPLLVVHPRNENDLRKAARFSWQLAERGRVVPITMRGKGCDQTGAALGSGIVLSTPAHMNKIIELDPKSGVVTVQAGVNAAKLQQTLHTHGRFLPSLSDTAEYTTIGGAVANNEAGRDSYKYGPIREHTTGMRVVLANGELIRTSRLSKRELGKKLGLASFEGQVYREMDKLIEDNIDVIESLEDLSARSNVGYAITDVKLKDGSFDLTPLFVGSQSTLGLMSEITLETQIYDPAHALQIVMFNDRKAAFEAVQKINQLKQSPACVDFIDKTVLEHVRRVNPSLLKSTIGGENPEIVLFIKLEQTSGLLRGRSKKALKKIFEQAEAEVIIPATEARESWEVVRDSVSYALTHDDGHIKSLPIVSDAVVPVDKMVEFMDRATVLLEKFSRKPFVFWGQAGSGIIRTATPYNVSEVGDRQKMFKLIDEYYNLVAEVGGSVSGSSAEGRLRASQVYKTMTPEVLDLMQKIKKIFDPFNTLNPGVKIDVDIDRLKTHIRSNYSLEHQHSHLPRG